MRPEHFRAHLGGRLALEAPETDPRSGEIVSGTLLAESGPARAIPIRGGIPRFISAHRATDHFGFQWNTFRSTQLDSCVGLPLTATRMWKNTRWTPEELRGASVLEAGSGAGRFTEVLLQAGARVVSFDSSNAVDANRVNNSTKGDLFLLQCDILDIPLAESSFDLVFCYGVLQHTPDPAEAYRRLFRMLKPGGKISIDYYLKHAAPTPWSTPKYLWRPVTTRLKPATLFKLVSAYVPLYLPIDTLIRRLPRIGLWLCARIPIPCWNYLDQGLSPRQRREWAILDTFDALGAAYDSPKTLEEVRAMVSSPDAGSVEVFYGSNGVVANVTRRRDPLP
jgi:SAM-dependent methyltransferase